MVAADILREIYRNVLLRYQRKLPGSLFELRSGPRPISERDVQMEIQQR